MPPINDKTRPRGQRGPPVAPLADPGLAASTSGAAAPQRIGPFELVRALGAGGMGEVYEAVDARNGQRVALKMLHEIDPAAIYRLKREFRRMADISHDNLVDLYELHNDGTSWFITMELLSGTDLMTAMVAALAGGLDKIRPLVRKLVRGVHALHHAGRIHRDLKPMNIMVTSEGRVVILDFGLVNEIDGRTLFSSAHGLIHGTPAYMAPEQAAGQLATAASDWYAVGTILFAAVARRYPFEGGIMEILAAKQRHDAPRLSTLLSGVPRDLDDLVAGLLRRVPSERLGGNELLAWCSDGPATRSIPIPAPQPVHGALLERELQAATLHAAFRRVLAGHPTCVDIVGAAGTGKTALVRRFIKEFAESGTVILVGACSQRESVPFRALDGLLDAITAHLVHLPARDREAMLHDLGGDLHALAQIFPVLARVAWIAHQVAPSASSPAETRRAAFQGLKLLLFRIAERRPTIIFLDNLQWGDLDSARLFDYLLAPPVPACLVLAAYRRDRHSPMLRDLAHQRAMTTPVYDRHEIETTPLSPAAATTLAQQLLRDKKAKAGLAQRIAVEAAGCPSLIQALVDEATRPGAASEPPSVLPGPGEGDLLCRLVRARLSRLADEARQVFARVVASRSPLLWPELLRSGTWEGDVFALVAQLQRHGLVHLDGMGEAQQIAPISEPIQVAARAVLDPELLQRAHHDLAAMLVLAGADEPERIARHLHAAGLFEQAYEHISSAAFMASKALAYHSAAELYLFALECKKGQWSLQKRCAMAQVLAGRGAEAAPLFLLAAATAPAAAAATLRREAAEQFLAHGDLDRGMDILSPLLRAVRIEVPRPGRDLNTQLTAHTERLLQRGLAMVERSEFEIGSRDLERIDLCWTAGKGLLLNEPGQAGLLLAQCAYMSLEAGEPKRAARSLALCGLAQSNRSLADAEGMVAEAERIAARIHDHYAIGLTAVARGILARISGHWLRALTDLDFGVQYLREHCPGVVWDCSLGQASTMAALEALGEYRTMSERTERLLRQAKESGDMHTSLIAAIYSALTLIAAGHPARARARVRDAFSRWPQRDFRVQHLHALKIGIYCDLYDGRPTDAWHRIVKTWPLLEASDFLRVSARRREALILRAKVSLAAIRAAPTEYGHLAAIVEQDIAQIEREGGGQLSDTPACRHLIAEAALLRAGLAAGLGDQVEATRCLGIALSGFNTAGMSLTAVAVRRLIDARTGRRPAGDADALLSLQNIKNADAWLRIVAPGLVE